MQLVARGAQERYISIDPEFTYFKALYRRHTNFAMESIEQTFNGSVGTNKRVSATISRNGDLVHRMWLEITCNRPVRILSRDLQNAPFDPVFPVNEEATRAAVFDLIDTVSVEIGGTRVDRHTGSFIKIMSDLSTPFGKRSNLDSCLTSDSSNKYIIPLSFWFCKDVSQALPLIALQYHEVKVDVTFKAGIEENVGGVQFPVDVVDAKLWVDYIYLDTEERRRFARMPHEYLIEQMQTTGTETIGSGPPSAQDGFYLSTTTATISGVGDIATFTVELLDQPASDVVLSLTSADPGRVAVSLSTLTFTNGTWNTPQTITLTGVDPNLGGLSTVITIEVVDASSDDNFDSVANQTVTVTTGPPPAPKPQTHKVNLYFNHPVKELVWEAPGMGSAKLQLNGHDRFVERDARYFKNIQQYQYHTGRSADVFVYSFALEPEKLAPSGTCNFSRIDNATLTLVGGPVILYSLSPPTVTVYAINYNVLRIQNGMGGLAYSN